MNLTRSIYLLFLIALILSGFWYIGSALTALMLLTAVMVGGSAIFKQKIWRDYSLTKLMLIYLTWLFIVAYSSNIPNPSILAVAVLAGLPVLYLTASNSSILGETWHQLRIMFFLSGVGLAMWGLWQVIAHIGYGWPVGPLVDRNVFAALMNLLWFPAAYLYLTNTQIRSKAILYGAGLFIISMALFATASRAGIATWLLLLPLFLWAGVRYTKAKWWVASIPLLALLGYYAGANLGVDTNIANRSYALSQDASTSARLLMWQSTIKMAIAHPLTGTGWGTFAGIYPAFRSHQENSTAGVSAHNDYLQLAAEGGFPALIILLVMLLGIVWQLRSSIKLSHKSEGFESNALLLGVLAIFIHASLNFIFSFAFMNIIAGIYLARAAQLTEIPCTTNLPRFDSISHPIKYLVASFTILLIATPFALHLIAQACLTGSQPGLKLLNRIAPNITTYDIAKLITAIRPEEGIAQEVMLQVAESGLENSNGISMTGGNFKRELLNEALNRYDTIRSQTANSPSIGVREVKTLLAHQADLPPNFAYAKAHDIIVTNLKTAPYHVDSLIVFARLRVAEGHRDDAIRTLQWAKSQVLSQRDFQLLDVEILRQLAAPKIIPELDDIEKQLRQVRSDSETGKPLILAPHFSEDIDKRLQTIATQIQSPH
ncbi:O-antigen ligase family protein [Sulfuriferula thiophila]|uniref:O-antigen ligase family protein n=1 Tax=Sulfuriferula thiophila TaxID=1781211 RepID=UPI000F609EB2|nr:O-antigen ligase family protein [Sulfuriferula thiophila]